MVNISPILTGTTAAALIERMGCVNFDVFTTIVALPGLFLFWFMMRRGLVDRSLGSAGTVEARRG